MKRCVFLFFYLLSVCTFLHAQTNNVEEKDTTVINLQKEFLETTPKEAAISENANPDLPALENSLGVPKMNWTGIPSLLPPTLPSWGSGGITGFNGIQSNLMLGGIYYSSASIYQNLGRYWTVSAGVDVTKYGVAYNQAYFNGSIIYHPSNNFSLTLFGSYYPGSFLSQMPIGQAWRAGGFISLETDNHWGIDLGATHSYNAYYGHSITPIIMPYYKLGGGAKLGIDFGPMLKHFMNNNGRSNSMDFNPIMPKPMNGLPPVAPRR